MIIIKEIPLNNKYKIVVYYAYYGYNYFKVCLKKRKYFLFIKYWKTIRYLSTCYNHKIEDLIDELKYYSKIIN